MAQQHVSGKQQCTLVFIYLSYLSVCKNPTAGVTLQSLKETSEVLVFPRVLSQAEQAKVLEACHQAAVLVDLDMLPGSTSISLMGVAGRVSKVGPLMQALLYMLCARCMGEATISQHGQGNITFLITWNVYHIGWLCQSFMQVWCIFPLLFCMHLQGWLCQTKQSRYLILSILTQDAVSTLTSKGTPLGMLLRI